MHAVVNCRRMHLGVGDSWCGSGWRAGVRVGVIWAWSLRRVVADSHCSWPLADAVACGDTCSSAPILFRHLGARHDCLSAVDGQLRMGSARVEGGLLRRQTCMAACEYGQLELVELAHANDDVLAAHCMQRTVGTGREHLCVGTGGPAPRGRRRHTCTTAVLIYRLGPPASCAFLCTAGSARGARHRSRIGS